MEYISSKSVSQFMELTCTEIDSFPLGSLNSDYSLKNEDPSAFLRRIFKRILKYLVMNRTEKDSRYYAANFTNIGCAIGNAKNVGMLLNCITSIDDPSSFQKAYLPGSPCSNCSMFNQVCSKTYPGLCEDSLKGEKCAIGERGITGADGLNGEKGVTGIAGVRWLLEIIRMKKFSTLIIN